MTTETKNQTRKWTLDLGKVDANGRGRKVNRVTLDVELRHKANDTAPYLDVDLNECREYTELSICGAIWNAAGSDWQGGGQNLEEVSKLFPDDARVQRLVEIWRRWHLNGMKAGTRLQEAYLRDNPVTDRLDHYGKACALLEKANLLTVTGGAEVPNANGAMVRRNYKYGSAWLVDPLPADVEAEVVRLCGELSANIADQASEPKNFAEEHGIVIGCTAVDSNPNMPDAAPDMSHWRCVLTWKEKKGRDRWANRLTVYFSQGSAHTEKPTAMDVLGCLASDAWAADYSFADWCSEFGDNTDSRKAERTYKTVKKQTANLKRFLGDGLFRALLEDSNG